jgi:2-oxoglutarate ferredoxin oxidoreductase subunit alpha
VHFTGLTHDERGYPALNADSHEKLICRLVDKVTVNAKELAMHEEFDVEDADTVVISFGVTARAAASATAMARKQGMKVGHLRLITIWPFPEARVRELTAAGTVKKFVVPEINLGQVRREVERLTHLPAKGVCHPGGRVITPEDILKVIAE